MSQRPVSYAGKRIACLLYTLTLPTICSLR